MNAKVVHVGAQDQKIMVWIEGNLQEKDSVNRKFITFGTGHEIANDKLVFIGSVQLANLVFHLYEDLD